MVPDSLLLSNVEKLKEMSRVLVTFFFAYFLLFAVFCFGILAAWAFAFLQRRVVKDPELAVVKRPPAGESRRVVGIEADRSVFCFRKRTRSPRSLYSVFCLNL